MAAATPAGHGSWQTPAAVGCLLINAFVWGVSWWPFRYLQDRGLHVLWATGLVFTAGTCLLLVLRRNALRHLLAAPGLLLLGIAAGLTNASFNWAVTQGEVVRVILLFYLMPIWALLLARMILGERFGLLATLRMALAFAGALVVLWRDGQPFPMPSGLTDWLAILGGMSFALNNVMLRKLAAVPEEARALAMFTGGMVFAIGLAGSLSLLGVVPALPIDQFSWVPMALLLTVAFLGANLTLQYGAARLPAQITAVVMLSEVVFGALSAVLVGNEALTVRTLVGGAMILAASLLATLSTRPANVQATQQ